MRAFIVCLMENQGDEGLARFTCICSFVCLYLLDPVAIKWFTQFTKHVKLVKTHQAHVRCCATPRCCQEELLEQLCFYSVHFMLLQHNTHGKHLTIVRGNERS